MLDNRTKMDDQVIMNYIHSAMDAAGCSRDILAWIDVEVKFTKAFTCGGFIRAEDCVVLNFSKWVDIPDQLASQFICILEGFIILAARYQDKPLQQILEDVTAALVDNFMLEEHLTERKKLMADPPAELRQMWVEWQRVVKERLENAKH